MSVQEDSGEQGVGNEDDLIEPNKAKHKIIRVLTVIAYTLSVSMAAILLSIYYVFMWDGHPTLARKDTSYASHSHPMAQQQLKTSTTFTEGPAIAKFDESLYELSTKSHIGNYQAYNNLYEEMEEIEENLSKENVLVDVPFEPTAIPVVEAKTEAPTASTPESLLLDENNLNEDEFPLNNFTHLAEITKRSPMLKKLLLSKVMD